MCSHISEGIYHAFTIAGKLIFTPLHKNFKKIHKLAFSNFYRKISNTMFIEQFLFILSPKNTAIFLKFITTDELGVKIATKN